METGSFERLNVFFTVDSNSRQALHVANQYFKSQKHIFILVIPIESLIGLDLRWEAPVHPPGVQSDETSESGIGSESDQVFPHLYTKSLHRDLIERTMEVERNEDTGEFDFDLEW
jgi:uncharacterized protein (DUF952 family)